MGETVLYGPMTVHAQRGYSGHPTALLSIRDVAQVLGVHRNTVHRLIRVGDLQPIRIGRLARFRPEEIDAYLERNREEHAGP
jgi:excisionase family DNA binding protein